MFVSNGTVLLIYGKYVIYLFRHRFDGVIEAHAVLIHHPQSFLEGLLKASADSHHLACPQRPTFKSNRCHASAEPEAQTRHCLVPTLFMELPILVETLRNLLRSQRGTFTTQ